MFLTHIFVAILAIFFTINLAAAETATRTHGGDVFTSGGAVVKSFAAERDVFVTGRAITATGTAGGDVHVAGFDVDISTRVNDDLYVVGSKILVQSEIAKDLSALGMNIQIDAVSRTRGNARLMGASIRIDGTFDGALSAIGSDVYLNGVIKGDARIVAQSISFGSDAVVEGILTYASKDDVTVPDRVADPDRVRQEPYTASRVWDDVHESWKNGDMPTLPTFISVLEAFVISLLFFVILGAIALTFAPKPVEHMRAAIAQIPGQVALLGILGLSVLFGMIPITALTIVGLPFVPIVLLSLLVAWVLGYALGAYAIARRVWDAFGGDAEPSLVVNLMALASAIVVIAILNFIPFVGWVANYTLVLLGVGAMTKAVLEWSIGRVGGALDADMLPRDD
jgi:hypothetical protein